MTSTLPPDACETDAIGFGGAPVRSLESLKTGAARGDLVFFGLNRELDRKFGTANPGTADFVRENTACMMPWTRRFGRPCHDIGVLSGDDPATLMKETASISGIISRMGLHPVLIACDHTASFANVLGTMLDGSHLTYIYFDAHFDFGMHAEHTGLDNGNFVKFLLGVERIPQVINVGGRSWSIYEPIYEEIPGFTYIPHRSVEQIIAALAPVRGQRVYVSIDADVLDPSSAPNTACPEPLGMSSAELLAVCDWIGRSCQVMGSDLCEIMPSRESFRSEQALMRCLHALFPRV